MITKYHNFSVEELLRLFVEERAKSEIVEELCQRLESLCDKFCTDIS